MNTDEHGCWKKKWGHVMRRRHGTTLIEVIAAMTAGSVMVGVAVGVAGTERAQKQEGGASTPQAPPRLKDHDPRWRITQNPESEMC